MKTLQQIETIAKNIFGPQTTITNETDLENNVEWIEINVSSIIVKSEIDKLQKYIKPYRISYITSNIEKIDLKIAIYRLL